MYFISRDDINIINNRKTENLKICLLDQGSKLPSPAEYNADAPIKPNKIIIKIAKKFTYINLLKFIIFFDYEYIQKYFLLLALLQKRLILHAQL